MNNTDKTKVIKDLKGKSIIVSRKFDAPLANVWRAFTNGKLLDQWWGPAPWRCETKSMNFTVGGQWLYKMVGPEDEKHWACMNYNSIDDQKNIEIEDAFCDENGSINHDLPVAAGQMSFTENDKGTLVEFKMKYSTEEDVNKLIDMGFEQGIKICYDQLDELLVSNKSLV